MSAPTISAIPRRPAITFDTALPHGDVETVRPGLRGVLVNNPGPLTARGTNTWVLGRDEITVIDPGPHDPAHLAALLRATRGERITAFLFTHIHADHCGGGRALAAPKAPSPSISGSVRNIMAAIMAGIWVSRATTASPTATAISPNS
jgi:glyoxylase-like metal-dependent hydrolase (beta-lactamase superfamily II)